MKYVIVLDFHHKLGSFIISDYLYTLRCRLTLPSLLKTYTIRPPTSTPPPTTSQGWVRMFHSFAELASE